MNGGDALPIKVVFPRPDDYKAPPPAGGGATMFGVVDDALRATLAGGVRGVARHFEEPFRLEADVPAVAKITLKREAVAKSHRPTELFNSQTCPIIGGNALGELYVSVEPRGLDRLARTIEEGKTKHIEANISTLQAIQPYTAADVLGGAGVAELQDRIRRDRRPLRVRLFRHASRAVNAEIDARFERLAGVNGIGELSVLDYAEGLRVYRAKGVAPEALATLAGFVGIQSLSLFPGYRIVRTAARTLGDVTGRDFPPPVAGMEYPLVGLIDTGTDPNNPHLRPWVAARHAFVPPELQDNDHGSFVAGLVIHGRKLNHDDPRFPSAAARIVDVVAFDRAGEVAEDDLLMYVDEALRRFPEVRVWNLSLGRSDPCGDDGFSEFGAALDERSKRCRVLFVVAAGNFNAAPFRSWPPQDGLADRDRICPPADALRAITVGSLAHMDTAGTRVRRGEPSPFSRRGPGPAYLIKPELACYGGNCDGTGQYVQTGVISIDGRGHLAENIGTSFATPLVSALVANVEAELNAGEGPPSVALVKALVVHASFVRNSPLDAILVNYSGLGCPPALAQIINCTKSSATVIFQVPVQPKPDFGKRPFPMPRCLVDDRKGLRGEVFMTLLYEPPLDRQFGIEYCRCNVNASLGTVGRDGRSGKEKYVREINPVPKELNSAYEEELIKHGFKWSPLKLYHRKFTSGPRDKPWRLTLDMMTRSDFTAVEPQDVVLIVTVRGLANEPVYDELVRDMDRLGWSAQNLQVRSRTRLQP